LSAYDGESGLSFVNEEKPDIIILDIMLPKVDGFEFCKTVRKNSQTPILILTARKEEIDKVLGLELGADDYVTKPFSIRELVARIKAILKRTSGAVNTAEIIHAGGIEIDLERFEIRVNGKPVCLSPREFEFLKCLAEADGKAMTRDQLLEKVWGSNTSTTFLSLNFSSKALAVLSTVYGWTA